MKPAHPTRPVNPVVRFAVERRITLTMAVLGILVLGWISLERLPLEFLPTFSSDSVSVSAEYRSASPAEIERLIVRPLEDSLGTINGIDTLSASATANAANLNITFVDGTDMELAVVDVRDRIDRVRHLLPDDLERIRIRRFQSSDIPVTSFHLSAQWPEARLYDFAETVVQRRLERLPGVAQVSVRGLRTPEIQIRLDPARLEAHGLDVREVGERLRGSNVNLTGGDLRTGSRKLLVRTVGELESLEEIRALPLGARGLRLGDVAEVVYTFPEQESFNFLNGVSALTVSLNKASTSNLLEVVDAAKAEIEKIRALPEAAGLGVRVFHDASIDVRKGLAQLSQAGLVGGALAILAVYLFLRRFRTTALVAIAMPVSVVFTFVIIYLLRQAGMLDITLNVVSLSGLMLALGMLVDNSIVVIESIFRHRNELGQDARAAALHGTSAVALPIVASTATTLCVFLPLVFLATGGFTRYLVDIGVTISIVSVAALLIALTVVPMVAAFLLKDQAPRSSRLLDRLNSGYAGVLRFTLRHRFVFVVLALLMLAGSWILFTGIEQTFSARTLERQITLNVDTPRQYSLEQTAALYEEIYRLIDAHREELDVADVVYSYDRGAGRARGPWGRGRRFDLYLLDEEESTRSTIEVQNALRELLPVIAGVELKIAQARGHGGSGGVTVELMGADASVLELLADQLAARLASLPMIRDVDTSLEDGDQEIHVHVARERAQRSGLSSQGVAFTVAGALSDRAVSHYKTESREIDMVMRYAEEDRETLDELKKVPVFGDGRGAALPLSALADFELVPGPQAIERENRLAKVTVTANAADPRSSYGALQSVQRLMGELTLPPGYSWSFGRWTRHQQEDQGNALFTLVFALILIYMLMAALFESFAQPFTIMFSVPFAFIGVGLVMKLAGQPRDSMTNIGLIILMGVVVNNAIVLIDHVNALRREGRGVREAIVLGGQHRLRPIVITAVTTILGLLPMVAPFFLPQVFGSLEGRAAQWAPVGLVIMGGLTTSTFLTLLIIPTIYSLIDDLTVFFRRVARAVRGDRPRRPELAPDAP
jgi:HAE1 family hydrophobic/amphiphilic exporter-1